MSEQTTKSMNGKIDERLLDKIRSSRVSGKVIADLAESMAEQAASMNAATTDVLFGYVEDDESVDGDFVPELIVRVKRVD